MQAAEEQTHDPVSVVERITQSNGSQITPDRSLRFPGAAPPFAQATMPIIKPAASGGRKAWLTRRVGGDQKGSDSLIA
jgi:hypothetical protein